MRCDYEQEMAPASTRSLRRVEGLTARTENSIYQNNHQNRQSVSNTVRRKRHRDPIDIEKELIDSKKARIEVDSRPSSQLKGKLRQRRLVIANLDVAPQPSKQTQTAVAKVQQQTQRTEKAVNGIKHELHKLQSSDSVVRVEKRKLRSQEGTRFKSELSAYFPNYDIVIGNDPEETRKC
jgi:hypothetical protein